MTQPDVCQNAAQFWWRFPGRVFRTLFVRSFEKDSYCCCNDVVVVAGANCYAVSLVTGLCRGKSDVRTCLPLRCLLLARSMILLLLLLLWLSYLDCDVSHERFSQLLCCMQSISPREEKRRRKYLGTKKGKRKVPRSRLDYTRTLDSYSGLHFAFFSFSVSSHAIHGCCCNKSVDCHSFRNCRA